MLPKFEPLAVPPGVRTIAWIRNETDSWLASAPLALYDGVLASSEQTADLVRTGFAGPTSVLPIGVDDSLFSGRPQASARIGVVSTVNQWGRERELYSVLRRGSIDFPLAIYGQLRGLSLDLEVYRHEPISFFSIPSLYQQAAVVLDDMNHTTKPYGNVNSRVFEALAAGALVITNSSNGLAQLGLDEVPAYTDEQQLKEFIGDALNNPASSTATVERLQTVVRERHTYTSRAASFESFFEDLGRSDRPPILGFFPDYRATNPFTDMLYSGLKDIATPVPVPDLFSLDSLHLAREYGHDVVLHIHWTAPILGPSDDLAEAADRASRFEDNLQRLSEAGVKIAWTVHNTMPHESHFPELERSIRQRLADKADLIHVMSSDTLEQTADMYRIPPGRVTMIPHSSYVGIYPAFADRADARHQLELAEHHNVVLFLGGIRPYKGIDVLLDAFQRASAIDPDLRLVIAGRPARVPGLQDLEDRCSSIQNVLSNFNEVADEDLQLYYKSADAAVLPYTTSLNSGAAMLALSFGVPIIAPPLGAMRELLDADLGLSIEPGDTRSLADALLRVGEISTPDRRKRAIDFATHRGVESMAIPFAEAIRQLL